MTLPRINLSVEVTQSATKFIDIPAPGHFNYSLSHLIVGQIFVKKEDDSFEWVCNIDQNTKSGQWQLQPGNYRLVYRRKISKNTLQTSQLDFRITSNKTFSITL